MRKMSWLSRSSFFLRRGSDSQGQIAGRRVSVRIQSRLLRQVLMAIVLVATFVRGGLAQDCHRDIAVRVTDKHGRSLTNVTAAEIRAEINGNPANISSFTAVKPGIILVLDVSPSMKESWNQLLVATKQLVERFENAEIITFREKVQAYAIGRAKSEELLDQLSRQGPPSGLGGTALYDTLIQIGARVTGHNATIVLISDGGDNMSVHSSDATASLFQHSSWPPVFALILDHDQTDTRRAYFKKIPAATGGMILYPSSAAKVSSAVDEIAEIVRNPFVLTLEEPRSITAMAKLRLEAVGPDGKSRKDVHLLHLAEIPACESQPPDHP